MTSSIADKTRIIEAALDLRGAELRGQIAEHQALDTFLSYDLETRARVWRSMADRSRTLIVSAMLIRAYNDYDEASVALWVGRYNARWGTEPTAEDQVAASAPALTTIEAAIAGALETIATQADTALRASSEVADRAHWKRELNAANKALSFFLGGLRPQRTPGGDWLVASATQAGTVYRVSSTGCTCPAGEAGSTCWHATLITGVVMGYDTVELVDDAGDAEPVELPRPIDLGRRLAAARALLLVA